MTDYFCVARGGLAMVARLTPALWCAIGAFSGHAGAESVEFDPSFLNVGQRDAVDLSRFVRGASGLAGKHRVAVYLNGDSIGNKEIEFKTRADSSLYPCLTPALVQGIAFNDATLPKGALAPLAQGEACFDLSRQIPDAQVNFDSGEQRLDILIPQMYMHKAARGSVNSAQWDSGVSALFMNYNLNGYTSSSRGVDYNSFYAGLSGGANLGAWYLRHNGVYSWTQNGPSQYDSINTYLQRDIPAWQGRGVIGQSNTTGQLFDTLAFNGVQLASDERMLPESQRGYAPEIRGIARTNAQVTVRQGGQVIYQTAVTPGAFLIDDLYPTGYGGDLEVTVREADGSLSVFSVPYAAVTQLLRPGADRYEVVLGKADNDSLRDKPWLYQATYQRGLSNALTAYGGLQGAENYQAVQLGAAVGSSLGAVGLDVTQSDSRLSRERRQGGQSYRLSYSKTVNETGSSLSLAAYRFSTSGYMDFMTAMQTRDRIRQGGEEGDILRVRNRVTFSISQGLTSGWGQFYVSGSLQDYWNGEGRDKQYQLGYSNSYDAIAYSLSMTRSQSSFGRAQNNYLLSVSLPLGRRGDATTPQLRLGLARDSSGSSSQQATVSGNAGADRQFSYGLSAMNTSHGGSSGSLNGQYRDRAALLSGAYSTGRRYRSASAGLSGTVVGHAGGIVFSSYGSETFALVEAKGAEGAGVSNYPGVFVDARGYALVPYLNPYQLNEINLDPQGAASDIELDETTQKVAPYAGALVKVKYHARKGTPILIDTAVAGASAPFGAEVLDEGGAVVGAVGQGGLAYARVSKDRGRLTLRWGSGGANQCRLGYRLIPQQPGARQALQRFRLPCRSGDGTEN
ncbi:TPA: fimbria/pilus outer membrane usher protein [Serratia marcescens]